MTTIVQTVPDSVAGSSIDGRIPIHWVKKFEQDVYHLAQEEGSKLLNMFKHRSLAGAESLRVDHYEQRSAKRRNIGRKTGHPDFRRNTPVEYQAQEMGSTIISANAIYDADIFDKFDTMRQNHDVIANVKRASALAIGREIDDVILEAFKGKQIWVPSNADNANDTVSNFLSFKNTIFATDGVFGGEAPTDATKLTGLNLETLLLIKEYMMKNQVAREGQVINLTVRTEDLMSLLRDEKLISSDYNTVKALVDGETDYFAGIRFIRIDHGFAAATQYQSEFESTIGAGDPTPVASISMNPATGYMLGLTGGIPVVIDDADPTKVEGYGLVAFVHDTPLGGGSLEIAMEMGITSKFDVIPELFHSTQYLSETSLGASRLDPKATLQVIVKNKDYVPA